MRDIYEVGSDGQAERLSAADSIISGYLNRYPRLKIFEGNPPPGAAAAYREVEDNIVILPESDPEFEGNSEHWYRVLFHELVHSTGHRSREDRLRRRNDYAYGVEELVAELGSSYLTEDLQMFSTRQRHSEYLRHYVYEIAASPRIIAYAGHRAKEAVELILGHESKTANNALRLVPDLADLVAA